METGTRPDGSFRAAVIGTGSMAPGIAAEYARLGPTALVGRDAGRADAALAVARAALDTLAAGGLLARADAAAARENLRATTMPHADFAAVSLVSENISEDLDAKRALFARLDRETPPDALLLSNTSSLRITDIAAGLVHPERVIGTHYWNPPHLMPLVEIIPGERTDPARVAQITALLVGLGKEPVRVGREVPGFLWNRLQNAMLKECLWLVATGVATPEEIDRVFERGLGRRWSLTGMFASVRLGGSHTWARVAEGLFPTLAAEPTFVEGWREILTTSRPDMDADAVRVWREERLVALLRADMEAASSERQGNAKGAEYTEGAEKRR